MGPFKSHELMIVKCAILETFRGTMSDKVTTAKEFLEEIEKWFAKNEIAYALSKPHLNEV